MRKELLWAYSPVVLLALVSAIIFIWTISGSFKACSVAPQNADKYAKIFTALDGTLDVGLKLSTTLTGLGAALLIGLKSGVSLNDKMRFWILVSTLFFAQSAFYALLWRHGVAEIWLSDCLDLVTADKYQNRFQAHFLCFLLGLLSFCVVILSAWLHPRITPEYDS